MKAILVDPKVSISHRFHCTSEITYVCCKMSLRTSYTCTLVCITNFHEELQFMYFHKVAKFIHNGGNIYIFMFANAYSIGENMIM